jgi:hypothetical protein
MIQDAQSDSLSCQRCEWDSSKESLSGQSQAGSEMNHNSIGGGLNRHGIVSAGRIAGIATIKCPERDMLNFAMFIELQQMISSIPITLTETRICQPSNRLTSRTPPGRHETQGTFVFSVGGLEITNLPGCGESEADQKFFKN